MEWQPPPAPAAAAAPLGRRPCANRDPLRQPFFGDLHVHTGYSVDAWVQDTFATPDDAYRFATGEPIAVPPFSTAGQPLQLARIDRPLDFAAVTDHAEWLAEKALCTTPGSEVFNTQSCRIFRGETTSVFTPLLGLEGLAARMAGPAGFLDRSREVCGGGARRCRDALLTVWHDTQAAAERWYDRSSACRFTTFHAWEYSRAPASTKIHRNVILRNEIAPELPFSWIDTPTAPELWRKLRDLCLETGSGCDAIAIPHNPNLSNGQMFAIWYRELPLEEQRAQASLRARMEPLVEMMQVKGESECRNGMYGVAGGPDELCGFEKLRDLPGQPLEDCGEATGSGALDGRGCVSRLDYARYALLEGLREAERIGVNPYPFGFVGSTDSHLATPGAVAEWAYLGKFASTAESRLRVEDRLGPEIWRNPGGLAGLWAEENSRDSLFDAMRRREAFATSGPRMAPRFFGGWDLPADLCEGGQLVEVGYERGVPMGGDLPQPPEGAGPPVFAVSVLRDPGSGGHPGGLLQRLQIVKGWVGDDGLFHQRVYEVAGDPDNGADVDLATCQPRGPGAQHLCGVWRDPEFEPTRRAVYYARAIENPSCRWSTLQCLGLPAARRPEGCRDPRVPRSIQERAWTSPIWFEP